MDFRQIDTGLNDPDDTAKGQSEGARAVEESPTRKAHLKELRKPKRSGFLHWLAFAFALISLGIILGWAISDRTTIPAFWGYLEIFISVFFAIEFLTRSGLRWDWKGYMRTRLFDFIAIIPALTLVYFDVPYENIWIWVILAARAVRAIDRLLGDGFVRRNVLGLMEGFEEEVTDRVLLRIIGRVEEEVQSGNFARAVARSLEQNKSSLLERIREEHPKRGIGVRLAHLIGLDTTIEKVEEDIFDSVIRVTDSPEFDKAVREAVDSVFDTLKKEIAVKTWRQKMGIINEEDETSF